MSALVCGKRSPASFFEDEYHTPNPASKRIRCSAALHFSPTTFAVSSSAPIVVVSSPPPIDRLRSMFPDMDQQLLERALEASGNDLDIAIKNLNILHLETVQRELDFADCKSTIGVEADILPSREGNVSHSGENGASQNQAAAFNIPSSGSEWVELIVKEMSHASNMDDARVRASLVLEGLEKSVAARVRVEAAETFHKENVVLKEQVEKLLQEGDIWKRAFRTLHTQKEEFDRCSQEVQKMKMIMSQYDEQLSKLQMENYQLKLLLVQEQQNSPMPGRFHPDIFG